MWTDLGLIPPAIVWLYPDHFKEPNRFAPPGTSPPEIDYQFACFMDRVLTPDFTSLLESGR
ncbi:hypothetical protein TSUD_31130 [Trifolium subterraneum]|uniref:Uncharacterized protein n=1 Tax=Trifolium subterraneum TaxID=3900 RepID=A0A2Z6M3Z5_TRISU|nr:hypothetical protein TSUD_31130 [Trifolium subterraneum]